MRVAQKATFMVLSSNAIQDLRLALRKSYGADFDIKLSNEQVNHIGVLVLTGLVESLKMEIVSPKLFIAKA